MKTKPTLLVTLLIFMGLFAHAQVESSTLLKGQILDEQNKALPFANVLLLRAKDSSLVTGNVSDQLGIYVFDQINNGQYLLAVSMMGYANFRSQVFELNGGTLEMPQIKLNVASTNLKEVTVKAQKPFIELQADKVVVNVDASPVAAGNTALELLAKSPGVNVDHENRISLKGRSGVLVLMNGKQTFMSAEDLARLLENTPANSIESIEIISNPSAKYDAAGNAGIINIKMKKEKGLGTNGNLSLGAGYWENPRGSAELRMNHRSKKMNFFGTVGSFYNRRFQDIDISRRIPVQNEFVQFTQENNEVRYSQSQRINLGADWYLGKKTTLGAMGNLNFGEFNTKGTGFNNLSGLNDQAYNQIKIKNTGSDGWTDYTMNLNLRHEFKKKGHELSFDADYANNRGPKDQVNGNYFFNAQNQEVATPNIIGTNAFTEVDITALKLDYVLPVGKGSRLEAGLKSSFVETDNDLKTSLFVENVWQLDPRRSNQFIYSENIHAAYANFNTAIKKVNLQMGLRAELTNADGDSPSTNTRFTREYLNLFPSINISHPAGKGLNLSYSYSRRIDRPSYEDLNPFVFYLDQYTFQRGNPNITPQYTDALGLNLMMKGKYMLALNYNYTRDVITQILDQDDATRQTFQTMANLANFRNYSATLSVPIKVQKWWDLRANLVGLVNDFRSPFTNGEVDKTQFTLQSMVNNSFKLPAGIKAEANLFYQTRYLQWLFDLKPMWGLDLGFSKNIMKGKGSLKLNFNDVFFTKNPRIDVQQGTIDVQVRPVNESRRVNLNFNYKFGNAEVKPARRRSTATEAEQGRVKRN
jgi:hypothetical protein